MTCLSQGALAAPLQRVDLEWLIQRRPVTIGEQPVIATARNEHKPYVAGDEGIGNRRDGSALEIGVEDRKIEVVFPRCFQRLVNACGLGADGIADLTQHVREQHTDHLIVFDDEKFGLLRFGCHPSPLAWNRHAV